MQKILLNTSRLFVQLYTVNAFQHNRTHLFFLFLLMLELVHWTIVCALYYNISMDYYTENSETDLSNSICVSRKYCSLYWRVTTTQENKTRIVGRLIVGT